MNKKRKNNSELLCCLGLLLLIPIWMGLAPVWYEWFAENTNGQWMKWLYKLLDCRWLVNIPIIIAVAYLVYKWCRRIWNDSDIRLYRPILVILGLVVLFYKIIFHIPEIPRLHRCFIES